MVGSGAAGLTAALTAAISGRTVLLVESAGRFGGTSALSGGRVWIPPGEGSEDSHAAASEYLAASFGSESQPMIEAFVSGARRMARFVETHSRHRFIPCPRYPDYHAQLPGWTSGGRAYDAAPIGLGELVPEASDIFLPPGYLPITHSEWETWRFPAEFDWELIERRRENRILTNGASLVASLVDGAVRAGAKLVKDVALLDVEHGPGSEPIRARVGSRHLDTAVVARALILASGGFDANPELRSALLSPALGVSASIPTNTGIALQLAQEQGIAVDNLSQGWWMPMVQLPDETVDGNPYPRALVRERGVPHQIAVNRSGMRFVDEACPYHEFVQAMLQRRGGEFPNREAWLVFDQQFREKYPFPGLESTGPLPAHVKTDNTIGDLASRIRIDPGALTATVDRWNSLCRSGRDSDFGRGESLYDRYYGDPRLETSPNLGTIEQAPFYAVPITSGTIGSKGGPITTTEAQVMEHDGHPRRGWYAAGNAAASWTGDDYPAPGSTLGIGMTFAHRAAIAAIRSLDESPSWSS